MASQALVGVAGIGLVTANAWFDDRKPLSGVFGDGTTADSHKAAKALGLELIGVAALTLLAGGSGSGGSAALAIIAALWLVWLIGHNNKTHPTAGPVPGIHPVK